MTATVTGPVAAKYRSAFEEMLPPFDEVLAQRIAKRDWYSGVDRSWVFSIHYFQDGVEVGYFIPMVDGGFIFETPRAWGPEMKAQLSSDLH